MADGFVLVDDIKGWYERIISACELRLESYF